MKNKVSLVFWAIFMFIMTNIALMASVSEDTSLNPNDYARITDVEYRAVVVDEPYSEGKVVITERLTFDIHAASKNNLFWELWRDLCEDEIDGVKVHYKVNSVKQILDDGSEIVYEESPKLYWDDWDYLPSNPTYGPYKWYHSEGPYNEDLAQYECVMLYVDGLYREEVVFEIEYEMYNAALRYNDCSDLYLALYSGETIKYLESFKAEILFPNEDMPSQGNYNVYTYGTNSNSFPIEESATANPGYYTFSFELDEEDLKFKPYNEYIEFDLVSFGEDKHIFTENAPSNIYSYDDVLEEIYDEQEAYATAPERYKVVKIIFLVIASVSSFFIILHALLAPKRIRKKFVFFRPTEEIKYYRDIPSDADPNFAAALVNIKHRPPKDDAGIYSAILLSLARKKYIKLADYSSKDVFIEITDLNNSLETYELLTLCESYYYNLIIRHAVGNIISMEDFQKRVAADYENTDTFARNVKASVVNIGINEDYFQMANYNKARNSVRSMSTFVMIIGILLITVINYAFYQTRIDFAYGAFTILGISCIFNAVYRKIISKKYILLTEYGENEYAKWRGLYNYLNSKTLIHDRTIIELPIWEKYLVYATAFGLSEKVIKAIALRCPEAVSSDVLSNRHYHSRSFHHSSRSFRSAVHTGSHTASGGGFGYGGGGRGGGGGGGGH